MLTLRWMLPRVTVAVTYRGLRCLARHQKKPAPARIATTTARSRKTLRRANERMVPSDEARTTRETRIDSARITSESPDLRQRLQNARKLPSLVPPLVGVAPSLTTPYAMK